MSEEPFFKRVTLFRNIGWLNRLANQVAKSRAIFYPGALIKDKTHYFVERSNCSVGIFVNRDFTSITRAILVISGPEDLFLSRYAERLLTNKADVVIDIYDAKGNAKVLPQFTETFKNLQARFPNRITLVEQNRDVHTLYSRSNFMLIAYPYWNEIINADSQELQRIPSTLIINKKPSRFTNGRYKNNENPREQDNTLH